jgi:hypothetical protein
MSQSSIRPLSVGNVVSAGMVLYRSNLKTYFQLALIAYLWVLLPIYGWAKFCAIHGLMSRLAYQELVDKPESVNTARSRIDPNLWSFLGVGFGVAIRLMGLYLLLYFGLFLAFIIPATALGQQPSAIIVGGLLAFILLVVGIIMVIRFYSRWFIAEVPLAVEEEISGGSQSIDRSWELTKNAVGRIQYIIVVAFLVTLPIQIVTGYIPSFFQIGLDPGTSAYWIVYFISLAFSLLGGALVLPFWQAIKAVIYYDLCSRREGLDLRLRDRN